MVELVKICKQIPLNKQKSMLFQVTNYSLPPKMIPQYPPDFEDQILSTSFWGDVLGSMGF